MIVIQIKLGVKGLFARPPMVYVQTINAAIERCSRRYFST